MTKKELKKLARLQIPGIIESMDHGELFGDVLADLALDPEHEWVTDCLEEVKREAVKKLTPPALRPARPLRRPGRKRVSR